MAGHNAITCLRLPFSDPGIELDDMKGLAAWAVGVDGTAVFFRVVAGMVAAFADEMKPDFQHLFAPGWLFSCLRRE
jgi:hypothetical protein